MIDTIMKQFLCFLSWTVIESTFAQYDGNNGSNEEFTASRGRQKREAYELDSMSLFWIAAGVIVGIISLTIALLMLIDSPPATRALLWWKRRRSYGIRCKRTVDEQFPLGEIFYRDGLGGIILERDENAKQAEKAILAQRCARINGALVIEHSNGTVNQAFITDENNKATNSDSASFCSTGTEQNGSDMKSLSANKSSHIIDVANGKSNSQSEKLNPELNSNNENKNDKNYEVENQKNTIECFKLSHMADVKENE